jgi:hypothetical protein
MQTSDNFETLLTVISVKIVISVQIFVEFEGT